MAPCCFSVDSVAVIVAFAAVLVAADAAALSNDPLQGAAVFDKFLSRFGRSRELPKDGEEYRRRRLLFERRAAFVRDQNRVPGVRWRAALSRFSDRTDAERQEVLGYRRRAALADALTLARSHGASLEAAAWDLPSNHSWQHLQVAKQGNWQQGRCGSCWAISTVNAIEANYEIRTGVPTYFSAQEVLDCTPNPQHCGGFGKCGGSTPELALSWISAHGLSLAGAVPYLGRNGTSPCDQSNGRIAMDIGLLGQLKLTSNLEMPLLNALVLYGPVAVSAAAGGWFEYRDGIFDGCARGEVVNHGVTLYGYGADGDSGVLYWLIRNSWGQDWGEDGYIRVLRGGGEAYCGIDQDNQMGSGCAGDPTNVTVCGMCGVLADSSVPLFAAGSVSSTTAAPVAPNNGSLTEFISAGSAAAVIWSNGDVVSEGENAAHVDSNRRPSRVMRRVASLSLSHTVENS